MSWRPRSDPVVTHANFSNEWWPDSHCYDIVGTLQLLLAQSDQAHFQDPPCTAVRSPLLSLEGSPFRFELGCVKNFFGSLLTPTPDLLVIKRFSGQEELCVVRHPVSACC